MRIIESRSIDNQAGLLGSRLITGTNAIEGAFQSFIVAEDTIVTKVYNSIGIDVTSKLGLTSITLKAGAFISMPKGDYFSSIKLASGSVVAYFTSHGGQTITVDAYLNEFLARVGSSYLEASECVKAHLQQLINAGLLQKASLIMSPSMYEEDLVKSVVPQDGSGDLTFTRASDGTRINSAGLVENMPWNLATNSENFSAVYGGINATISNNTTSAPNATTTADSLLETTATDIHAITTDYTQQSGVQYTYSVYVKSISGRNVRISGSVGFSGPIALVDLSNGTLLSGSTGASVESVGSGWYRVSITSTTTTTTVRVIIYSMDGTSTTFAGSTSNGVYIWGAQLNIGSTAKPYFPTTDRLNVPRLTYQNGGGGCPSLLLEKQSTNEAYYSNALSTSPNVVDSCTTTANVYVSPDGTQNAMQFTETTANDRHGFYQYTTVTAQTYTASIFTKQTGRRYIAFNSDFTTGVNLASFFDLQTISVVSSASGHTCSIQDFGNGWLRLIVTLTVTAPSVGSRYIIWGGSPNGSTYVYSGSTSISQTFYGYQLEASSYPTSYIPTTSSSATRVADLSTSDTIQTAQTFAGDFTFFVDFVSFTTTDALGPTNQMLIGGGNQALGATYKSYFWITQESVQLTGDSETTIIASNKTFNANQRYKLLVKRNGTTVKIFCDGVQVGASATSSLSITIRSIGWSYSNNYRFNGLINQVVLSATGFSDADCQALTTI